MGITRNHGNRGRTNSDATPKKIRFLFQQRPLPEIDFHSTNLHPAQAANRATPVTGQLVV